jgi:hypothetical protein
VGSVDFLADLGPSANAQALARLLSAAAAPPRPHELRGYESARRAYEIAGSAGSAGAAPLRRGIAVPLRRMVGVKLAAVAGALTVTGVAVAAEADVLPSPIQRAAHQMLGGVGVPDPDTQSRSGQPMASDTSSASGSTRPGTTGPSGSADGGRTTGGVLPGTPTGTAQGPGQSSTVSADVLALCQAYAAQQDGQGGSLSGHDRHQLETLAGGADKVDGFCAMVLATGPSASTPQPTGGPVSTPTPDPSHDHKPQGTTSGPGSDPSTSTSDPGNGNGHSKSPNPTHTGGH